MYRNQSYLYSIDREMPPRDRFEAPKMPSDDYYEWSKKPPLGRHESPVKPPDDCYEEPKMPPCDKCADPKMPPDDSYKDPKMPPHDKYEAPLKPPVGTTPLLGRMSPEEMLENILKAITEEATAADFYRRLAKDAPNEFHCEFIKHAEEDELEHLHYFEKLYAYLSGGKRPEYTIKRVEYACYKDGLKMALKDELEAAEFYRDMQLSTTDARIRETFYYAMVDELEHATQFSTLYNDI